ncbi:acyl-CoA thioesterase [Nocardioides cynanchi]|uniref:acyl-CoA thioesterase n=1 Tax=Nocardioides cynanchi TaxID=2558918 RepID=UPI00124794C8|nr:thioesterase family protein [Nocardioides cynanchi]
MRHVYECPMRRADLHPGGTVNNVVFADYLQEARLDLLRRHDTQVSPQPGEGLVVVRTTLEYLAPLRLSFAPLRIETWVVEVRAASFTLGYELTTHADGEEPLVHARATTVLTPFVFSANRPRRLTAEERSRLAVGCEPSTVSEVERRRPAPWGGGAFTRPVHVRFSDIDLLGHVNNVRYLDYLQDAQTDLAVGVFQEARINGTVDLVVARTDIDYLGQMNLRPEPYLVWGRVEEVGSSSVTYELELRDHDRVMARSRVVSVNIGDDGRAVPMHPRHHELFEERREAARLTP